MASNEQQPAEFRLQDLPAGVSSLIAEKLERGDRACLAATCRALRLASAHWFRNDVFKISTAGRQIQHTTAHRLLWLCRINAQVDLELTTDTLPILALLAARGARIVALKLSGTLRQLPAELAGLAQLSGLSIGGTCAAGGWQHLPRQLQALDLGYCALRQVPAQLAELTQLIMLLLPGNKIERGWEHLPRELQRLNLDLCDLLQVPAELAAMAQLTNLSLSHNRRLAGGWQHLPRQLWELDLRGCGLQQAPAELAGLEHFQKLLI